MRKILSLSILALASSLPAFAAPVAYWRFETGPAFTDVLHSTGGGVFDGTTPDSSGNGNTASTWTQGGGAGFAYRSDVPFSTVPQTGAANNFSIKNTGGYPAMFTTSSASLPAGVDVETMTPTAFTVEASYKPENGGYRTVVGRDARNVATSNGDLAALYLQVRPNRSVGIAFTDLAGNFWEAFSAPDFITGFDWPTDNEGLSGTWYNLAGISDGTTLKMYVNNVLVASTDISASANPGLAVGTTNGGDWHAGEWSVGRGLYAGGHGDRAYGFIDEVRISNSVLAPNELLMAQVPEPGTMSLILVGLTGMAMRRRRSM